MPAKTELTWEQSTHRWKKVYKGRSYTVSCKALGVPPTKLESYQAANEWWAAKRTEIDGNPPPHPNAQHLDLLSQTPGLGPGPRASRPGQVSRRQDRRGPFRRDRGTQR